MPVQGVQPVDTTLLFPVTNTFFCGASTRFHVMAFPDGASRLHSLGTPHSVGRLWTSDQPDAETCTWKHTALKETNTHNPGGIRTHKPSNRAATRIGTCLCALRNIWDFSFHNGPITIDPTNCTLVIILIAPKLFCVFSLYNIKESQMLFKIQEMCTIFMGLYVLYYLYILYDNFYFNSCVSTLPYIQYTLAIYSKYHIYLDITVYHNTCIVQLTSWWWTFVFRNM
jgi:hypothetical protein